MLADFITNIQLSHPPSRLAEAEELKTEPFFQIRSVLFGQAIIYRADDLTFID